MSDVELNLGSERACRGEYGAYVGALYHLSGRSGTLTQFDMNDPRYDVAKPGVLINKSLRVVKNELGIEVEPDRLIALAISRICIPKPPKLGEERMHPRVRLERVASLAIASSTDDIEKVMPLNKAEQNVTPHGIGYARRIFPGQAPIKPLIHLPVTPSERKAYPVVGVIRSLATGSTLADQPYIALHGSEHGYIEQIVTPNQL